MHLVSKQVFTFKTKIRPRWRAVFCFVSHTGADIFPQKIPHSTERRFLFCRKAVLYRQNYFSDVADGPEEGGNIHRDASQRKGIYAERACRQAGAERKDDIKMGMWQRTAGGGLYGAAVQRLNIRGGNVRRIGFFAGKILFISFRIQIVECNKIANAFHVGIHRKRFAYSSSLSCSSSSCQ